MKASQTPSRAFLIQPLKKQKKKSKASEVMKQRRNKQKQQRQRQRFRKYKTSTIESDQQGGIINNNNNIGDSQCLLSKRPAKQIRCPEWYDKINYTALQEFEGGLQDERMLNVYSKAIKEQSHLFVNKIVLHLTTGCNCFYSIFSAEAGAEKVYCVVSGSGRTQKQNVWMIQQIIKQNKLEEVIQVMCFSQFNAQIDVIIGQPMGYVMHYDGMIDRMIQARDMYLDKKSGLMFPDKLRFKCALIKDEYFYDKKIEFWNQVYGIPMKTMKKWISHEPIVKLVDPDLIVSGVFKFVQFDLNEVTYEEVQNIKMEFQIPIYANGEANGLTIWYQIAFENGTEKIQLKSSPWMDGTKYTHVTLYTNPKIPINKNKPVTVKMNGQRYAYEGVTIMNVKIGDQQTKYKFS